MSRTRAMACSMIVGLLLLLGGYAWAAGLGSSAGMSDSTVRRAQAVARDHKRIFKRSKNGSGGESCSVTCPDGTSASRACSASEPHCHCSLCVNATASCSCSY